MWTTERLRERARQLDDTEYAWSKLAGSVLDENRKAAVLIPLVIRARELYVWLTLRAAGLRNDGGDVAFAGGMRDAGDADEASTCMREAEEEIGLQPGQVEILAHLPPTINRRQILISPVLALIDPHFRPVLNPGEVDAAFLLPLSRFLSARHHDGHAFNNRGITWRTHVFYDHVMQGHVTQHVTLEHVSEPVYCTWGLTANMCVNVAVALFQREPEFEWDGTDVRNTYALQKKYLERYVRDKEKNAASKL